MKQDTDIQWRKTENIRESVVTGKRSGDLRPAFPTWMDKFFCANFFILIFDLSVCVESDRGSWDFK